MRGVTVARSAHIDDAQQQGLRHRALAHALRRVTGHDSGALESDAVQAAMLATQVVGVGLPLASPTHASSTSVHLGELPLKPERPVLLAADERILQAGGLHFKDM